MVVIIIIFILSAVAAAANSIIVQILQNYLQKEKKKIEAVLCWLRENVLTGLSAAPIGRPIEDESGWQSWAIK
jgi:hypothetical protein